MAMKKALLKMFSFICGVCVVALIAFLMYRIFSGIESLWELEAAATDIHKDSFVTSEGAERKTFFYLLSSLFAGLAVFFALLSVFFRK